MYELKIVTPTRQVLPGNDVEEVFVPSYLGELNILPGHAPLVTTLQPGILKYRPVGQSELVPLMITWGYCEVHPKGVTILAESAQMPAEVDKAKAEQTLKETQEKLLGLMTEEEFDKYQRDLRQAQVRVEIANQ